MRRTDRLLSIIVPTFNCEDYIEEGITSILSQLPDFFELILVDDGSSDNTRDVLSRYDRLSEKTADNVIVIYAEHKEL